MERQPAGQGGDGRWEQALAGSEAARMHTHPTNPNDPPRPALRLFLPGDGPDEPGGITPRMTLGEFFDQWYLPVVLLGERNDSASTILIYRDALRWWAKLTGGPRIADITEYTTAAFLQAMRTALYRRGKLGLEKPLRPRSQRKLITALRAILSRLGPTLDPKRRGKALLPEAPQLTLDRPPRPRVKPPFAIEDARRMFAESRFAKWHFNQPGRGSRLKLGQCVPANLLLPAWMGLMYYTGQRTGTTLLLDWSMVRERSSGVWFEIDERCVPKTHKSVEQFCHPHLYELLLAVRRASTDPGNTRLIPFAGCYKALVTRHRVLQRQAGIPAERQQSPQAWRRTHGTELAKVGARCGYEAARVGLDHSDDSVTRDYYVNIQPDLILRLPLLEEPQAADDRQRRLFD